jgi:YggT family protein
MAIALYLIRTTAITLISVIELAMFARVILSLFDQTGESRISVFLYAVTEPVVLPVRNLCERMHWFEGVPLDIPFMLTWLVLMVAQMLLGVF